MQAIDIDRNKFIDRNKLMAIFPHLPIAPGLLVEKSRLKLKLESFGLDADRTVIFAVSTFVLKSNRDSIFHQTLGRQTARSQ
jgi:hypothetical protein